MDAALDAKCVAFVDGASRKFFFHSRQELCPFTEGPPEARPGKQVGRSRRMVLTDEQRARIERNRQEALAKRARALAAAEGAPSSPLQPGMRALCAAPRHARIHRVRTRARAHAHH